ncbi:HAD family hydrolase [Zhihengliuella halotolerans]|uniref:HAD family hydrolase n=1 Tax=Zhihengliuella halotolerans TaxID=370736 RepID=UPI000C80C01B|nr:HAD family hydrolase [Zhihengliuella halotolerans]
MLAPGIRAVGFDLDATLFDHHASAVAGAEAFVTHLGLAPSSDLTALWFRLEDLHFERWRAGEISHVEQRRERMRDFLPAVGLPRPADAAADHHFAFFLAAYRATWRAFDDAVPVLTELRAEGVPVGVLTNGTETQQLAKLEVTGLLPLVDVVCTAEGIGVAKPAVRAFEILAARLGVELRELAFIGDHPQHDVGAARAAGAVAGLVSRKADARAGLREALQEAANSPAGKVGAIDAERQ